MEKYNPEKGMTYEQFIKYFDSVYFNKKESYSNKIDFLLYMDHMEHCQHCSDIATRMIQIAHEQKVTDREVFIKIFNQEVFINQTKSSAVAELKQVAIAVIDWAKDRAERVKALTNDFSVQLAVPAIAVRGEADSSAESTDEVVISVDGRELSDDEVTIYISFNDESDTLQAFLKSSTGETLKADAVDRYENTSEFEFTVKKEGPYTLFLE